MYKIYFKQAFQMLKQNKFISIISIAGTALAIMMIMVIFVSFEVKNMDIAPEINRSKTLYIKYENKMFKKSKGYNSNNVNYSSIKNYLSNLKTPQYVSAFTIPPSGGSVIRAEGGKEKYASYVLCTDNTYWNFFEYNFIEGKAFSKQDFDAGIKTTVISESLAKKLYKNENALGKIIEIDFIPYKISGVTKDVSKIYQYAYADVWIPYTCMKNYDKAQYIVMLMVKNKKDFSPIAKEVRACEKKFNATDPDYDIVFRGPYDHRIQQLAIYSNHEPDTKSNDRKIIATLIILLLVPAINLSSFSLSRLKKRISEIGVRKAFGAKRHEILIQILYENFITSLIGGIIGLIFSFLIVIYLKEWLLGIPSNSSVPFSSMVSIPLFFGVFIVCFLLNILSAGIPAYKASKIEIVNSLKQNNI